MYNGKCFILIGAEENSEEMTLLRFKSNGLGEKVAFFKDIRSELGKKLDYDYNRFVPYNTETEEAEINKSN